MTLAAFVLTFASFGPALRAAFVSDDINAIVENEWVAGDFDPAGIIGQFSWWGRGRSDSPGYRPAATISFAANRLATGAQPSGFRVVNFALHALCAGLLFWLARALGLGREAAAAAAALFAVLPIHSEAVIWIVGRAELGAAAGFLLATLLCLLFRRDGSIALLAAAAAAIAVGMAFKENAVTALAAPVIFLAVGRRDAHSMRRDAAAFAALLAGAAAYACVRLLADGPAMASAPQSLLDNPLSVVPAGTRLLGALAVFGRYVSLTFWPASLSVDYSYDALGIGPGFVASRDTAVAVVFVLACVWAVVRGPGRREFVAAGLLLAAASFSIVSNTVFVLGTILGERLFYLPTAGIVVALAAMAEPAFASHDRRRRVVAATAVIVLAAAAIATDRRRSAEWVTPVTLFEAAVRAVPSSARAHMELASAYGQAGRVDDAARHFGTALAIKPDYAAAAYNQGNTLARAGRYEQAAEAYRKALAIDPKFARAWHNLALTERFRGRPDAWLEAMRGAVASSAPSPTLENELGEALLAARHYEEAVSVYEALIAGGGAVAASHFNLGVARHHLGGCRAAVEDYRRATLAPTPPREAFAAAAGCLRELGRNDEAASVEQGGKVANRGTHR